MHGGDQQRQSGPLPSTHPSGSQRPRSAPPAASIHGPRLSVHVALHGHIWPRFLEKQEGHDPPSGLPLSRTHRSQPMARARVLNGPSVRHRSGARDSNGRPSSLSSTPLRTIHRLQRAARFCQPRGVVAARPGRASYLLHPAFRTGLLCHPRRSIDVVLKRGRAHAEAALTFGATQSNPLNAALQRDGGGEGGYAGALRRAVLGSGRHLAGHVGRSGRHRRRRR